MTRRGRRRTRDLVGVVETAYSPAASVEAWLAELAAAAERTMGYGEGVMAVRLRLGAGGTPEIGPIRVAGGSPSVYAERIAQMNVGQPPEELRDVYGPTVRRPLVSSVMEAADALQVPSLRARWEEAIAPHGHKDVVGVFAPDLDGSATALWMPTREVARFDPWTRLTYERIAVHISTAWRLRNHPGFGRTLEPDAVLSPSGKLLHAGSGADQRPAREALRRQVVRVERARGRMRSEPGEALELWQGLVSGTWSLVDQFERDGRRFVFAVRNPPGIRASMALRQRELEAVGLFLAGHTPKLIAYALGLSASTVASHLRAARMKLGLLSLAELARLGAALLAGEPGAKPPPTA